MSEKLTPWFDGGVFKPSRPGVYERSFYAPYSYWDGEYWHDGAPYPELAYQYGQVPGIPGLEYSESQDAEWRGLATPPKGE